MTRASRRHGRRPGPAGVRIAGGSRPHGRIVVVAVARRRRGDRRAGRPGRRPRAAGRLVARCRRRAQDLAVGGDRDLRRGPRPAPVAGCEVLDSSGHDRGRWSDRGGGRAAAGPPGPASGTSARGVYTVAWTTVSAVDGHLASGTFAFGVRRGPRPACRPPATTTSSAPARRWPPRSRWLLYAGLMLLVGRGRGRRWPASALRPAWPGPGLSVAAWPLAAGRCPRDRGGRGVRSAHVALGHLLDSTFGHQLEVRIVPLLVGAALLAVAPHCAGRAGPSAVLGLAGLVAMWGDVTDSHAAAADRDELLKMVEQWAALRRRGRLDRRSGHAARRPRRALARRPGSGGAAVLGHGAGGGRRCWPRSGVLRAIDEVGSWHALTSTSFGRLILVKCGLLLVLVGLGAVNRYPFGARRVEGSPRPLARLGRVELAIVAVVVLVATAVLQGLAPPASVGGRLGPPAGGGDRPRLRHHRQGAAAVSPGTTGFNQFDAGRHRLRHRSAADRRPRRACRSRSPASRRSAPPPWPCARPPAAPTPASGPNLSIDGTWR